MLFDDDEWLQCPDHRKLKAWKKQPGGGWLQYFLEASECPHRGGDGTAWEMGQVPLGLGLHGSGLVTGPRGSQSGL